jgi:hypothetical protein
MPKERIREVGSELDKEPVVIKTVKEFFVPAKVQVTEKSLSLKTAIVKESGEEPKWRPVLEFHTNDEDGDITATIWGITPPYDKEYDHKKHSPLSMVKYGPGGNQLLNTDISNPDFLNLWEKQPERAVFASRRQAMEALGMVNLDRYTPPGEIDMEAFVDSCLELLKSGERNPAFIQEQLDAARVPATVGV